MACAEALKLLEELYENHNIHFADKNQRPQLEKDIAGVIAALPLETTVRPHAIAPSIVTLLVVPKLESSRERAQVLFIQGKALNALPEFDQQAYQCLSRSVPKTPHSPQRQTEIDRERERGNEVCRPYCFGSAV